MANKSLAAAQKAYAKGKSARQTAAKKGVVTSQRPQKKKRREEQCNNLDVEYTCKQH